MGRRDEDGHLDAWVRKHVLGQLYRKPVAVKMLVRSPRPSDPRGHADDVAVVAVDGLGKIDHVRPVQVLQEGRIPVEDVVDVLVEEPAVVRRAVPVEAGLDRREAGHHLLQLRNPVGVQRLGKVRVSVFLDPSHAAGKVGLRLQFQGFSHSDPPV